MIRYPSGKIGNRFAVPAQVRKIGSRAFWFCNNLSEVALTDNIEEIGSYAFWECYIKNVYFGKNLRVVGESAFGHTKLTQITLPSRVTWGRDLFEGCSSLTRAVIEEGITEIPDRTFDSCISLAEVSLPSSLRTIGQSAFEYTALKTVTLPDSVTVIVSRAFYQSEKKTVKAGKSIKLKTVVKAQKSTNKSLKWTSSNTKYAKVSKSGKVTAYKAGKGKIVTITAQAVDGTGKKAKLKNKIK